MKHNVMLTIASLLSILFLTFHLTDDIVRGMEPGTAPKPHWGAHPGRLAVRNAGARRTAIGVRHHPPRVAPWVGRPRHPHDGEGCRRQRSRKSSGAFFFVWTLLALGVTALFSVILSVRGLWSLQWGQPR